MDKDNIMHQDTVALDPETEELVILDQTRLPGQTVFPGHWCGGGHRHLCGVPADAGYG